MPSPKSGRDLLARIKPQRRVERTKVCLRADLISEFQDEDAKLLQLKANAAGNSNRMNPGAEPDTKEIRAQARKVRKLEGLIEESQVEFVFESRNKIEWAELTANHPPRRDNKVDQIVGYHRDEVLDATVRASLIDPVFEDCVDEEGNPRLDCDHDECGTWQQLVAKINPAEWTELRDTANLANSGVVDPPKSLLASAILDKRGSASA